jgi:hypothetical protein
MLRTDMALQAPRLIKSPLPTFNGPINWADFLIGPCMGSTDVSELISAISLVFSLTSFILSLRGSPGKGERM